MLATFPFLDYPLRYYVLRILLWLWILESIAMVRPKVQYVEKVVEGDITVPLWA